MTTFNDAILESWGPEDDDTFFDPVYGDGFHPHDEFPWLVDALKQPSLLTPSSSYAGMVEHVDPMEDQHNSRWSLDT